MTNPSNPYGHERMRDHGLDPEDPSIRPPGESVVDGAPESVKSDRAGAVPDLTGSGQAVGDPFASDPGRGMSDPDDDPSRKEGPDLSGEAKRTASNAADRAGDVADTAKGEASKLADTSADEAKRVAGTVKDEAGHVFEETKHQTRRIVDDGLAELKQQAGVGQERLADVVRSLTGELESMTDSSSESGPVMALATRAQRFGDEAASWLENTSSEDLLDSVRRFAARRPMAFLAISAGVGFVAARLVRSLSEGQGQAGGRSTSTSRHLDAPSYADDDDRLSRRSQPVGDAPLASEIRGMHQSRSAEEEILGAERPDFGGTLR